MVTKNRLSSAASKNPNGVWSALTRMVEDPKFANKVARAGVKTLAEYDLARQEVSLLSKAAKEGLDRLFEGNPGAGGKALAVYMGTLRSKVGAEERASLNGAAFRRYIDPLRLHAMHAVM